MLRQAYRKGQSNFKAPMACTPPVTCGQSPSGQLRKSPFRMGFHSDQDENVWLDHNRNDLVQSHISRSRFKMQRILTYYPWNTLSPRQNGRHFADDIFKCIFLNENARIWPKISMMFVPKVRINNIPSLVQIMAWRRPGDKSLSEPMMVSLLTHICVTRPHWVKIYFKQHCNGKDKDNLPFMVSGELWSVYCKHSGPLVFSRYNGTTLYQHYIVG